MAHIKEGVVRMDRDMQLVFDDVKKTIKKCRPFPEALLGSLYGVGVVIDPELQGNDWYICCSQEMVDELKKEIK